MMKFLNSLDFEPRFDFNKELLLKDFSLNYLFKIKPQLNEPVNKLISFLPNKKFLTIDYFEQILTTGEKTCRDINWHVDGIDNQYILVAWGDYRTEFLTDDYLIPHGKNIRDINYKIKNELKEKVVNFIEVPINLPVLYDSKQVHRGRDVKLSGKRVFIRICASDYLEPKNHFLNKKREA